MGQVTGSHKGGVSDQVPLLRHCSGEVPEVELGSPQYIIAKQTISREFTAPNTNCKITLSFKKSDMTVSGRCLSWSQASHGVRLVTSCASKSNFGVTYTKPVGILTV